MATRRAKPVEEHVSIALNFLADSEREFADGEHRRGSEKLWGAASQSVMAIAKQRGWRFGKSNNRADLVERLVKEHPESSLELGYAVAEKFHANLYHDFMEDDEIARGRPMVTRFVHRILALAEEPPRNQ